MQGLSQEHPLSQMLQRVRDSKIPDVGGVGLLERRILSLLLSPRDTKVDLAELLHKVDFDPALFVLVVLARENKESRQRLATLLVGVPHEIVVADDLEGWKALCR